MSEKASKFSVSFPPYLMEAMDRHLGGNPRSRYLQGLAEMDLKKAGVLDNDPIEDEVIRLRELVATRGIDVVRQRLDDIAREAILAPEIVGGGR